MLLKEGYESYLGFEKHGNNGAMTLSGSLLHGLLVFKTKGIIHNPLSISH